MVSALTALLSVATPETTNMRLKEMMNSMTSDCTSEPAGTVPKKCSLAFPNSSRSVRLAAVAPITCAAAYAGTCFQGNRPQVANATETAGFRCAPEMWPTEYTITITASPHTMQMPGNVTVPPVRRFTATAAHPAKMRK